MEDEQKRLQAELAQGKKEQRDTFDVEMRLNLLEVRMNMLIASIQEGKLTQEGYVAQVTAKIQEEQQLLARLQAMGRDKDAERCRHRIQLMKNELGL